MPTLYDARQRLSYLLGESSQPSSTSEIALRDQFINDSLIDVYNRREWAWTRTNATVPIVNGLASLPSTVRQEGVKDLREVLVDQPDHIYRLIDYREFDSYNNTSYVYRLTGNAESGSYLAQLSVTNASIATVYFTQKPPLLANVSDTFPLPNGAMILAKGALMYYRMQQDPQADVTPESQSFENEILKLVQLENRDRPRVRAIGIGEYLGYGGTGSRPKGF